MSHIPGRLYDNSGEVLSTAFQQIIDAIENKDKNALKELFSKRLLKQTHIWMSPLRFYLTLLKEVLYPMTIWAQAPLAKLTMKMDIGIALLVLMIL